MTAPVSVLPVSVTADPDGTLSAPIGTVAIDQVSGAMYVNTDGATAWKVVHMALPKWASGRYYYLPNTGSISTSAAQGVGTMRMLPFYVPSRVTITKLGAEVTVIGDAGSKVRLGIYADDGTMRPGSLLLDAGTIAGDSATVQEITSLSLPLGPGLYWTAAAVQVVTVTQPTVRTATAVAWPNIDIGTSIPGAGTSTIGFFQTSVTGAFPSPCTPAAGPVSAPRMFCKT